MHQIDYEVFDKLLTILYEKEGVEAIYIAEELRWILGKEISDSLKFHQIYPKYMAELTEHGLARERGDATIMDITRFGRQVYKAGGWTKYSQERRQMQFEEQQKQGYKEQIELEKTQREIEKLKYEASIREKDERIKSLTAMSLTLQNSEIIYRWVVGIVGLLAGFGVKTIVEHWSELLQWLTRYLAR